MGCFLCQRSWLEFQRNCFSMLIEFTWNRCCSCFLFHNWLRFLMFQGLDCDFDTLRLSSRHLLSLGDVFFCLFDFLLSLIMIHWAVTPLRFIWRVWIVYLFLNQVPNCLRFTLILHPLLLIFQSLALRRWLYFWVPSYAWWSIWLLKACITDAWFM